MDPPPFPRQECETTPAPKFAGYSVCIFAYGQTGSGKTHTMAGTDVENYEGRGINYRALDDLFAIRESRKAEVRIQLAQAGSVPGS